jgi:hypothetical protein
MDAGKVRMVLNALREELRARETAGAQPAATEDGAPVRDVRGTDGAELDSGHRGMNAPYGFCSERRNN